ncbi:MAG: hypothetical protein ACPGF7_00335 [Pontibacterium sp.]
MSDTPSSQPPLTIEKEVDLIEYLQAILRAKYRILILAMISAISVFGLSKLVDDIYVATAVLAININESPGGVAPKDYRGSDTLGLLEHDFIIESVADNERERLMARMRSMRFSEIFIDQNNLLPYIYSKHWDAEAGAWKDKFKPVKLEAIKIFQTSIRATEHDEKTGLLLIHFKTRDPQLSAELANRFGMQFNDYIRSLELDSLKERREFLENRLKKVANIEMQRSIYRMLEVQLAAESLLFARKFYPLEEIQPAVAPLFKASPKRKSWAILAFVGTLFLGIVVILGWTVLKKLRTALKAYAMTEPLPEEPRKKHKKNKKGRFGRFSRQAKSKQKNPDTPLPDQEEEEEEEDREEDHEWINKGS